MRIAVEAWGMSTDPVKERELIPNGVVASGSGSG